MRVLLSDGWSLAARQTATILGWSGHDVEVLGGSAMSLCRHTRHVRHVHQVPPFGNDPIRWLSRAREVCLNRRIAVLIPTQEQVAVLSAFPDAIQDAGSAVAVPPFAALRRTQDKVSAARLLAELELPQPAFTIVTSPEALLGQRDALPVFVKAAIGTASAAVRAAATEAELVSAARELAAAGAFADAVLVQARADGPLAMVQSVFHRGDLVAHHVNLRVREGAGGGACHKESVRVPVIEAHLRRVGRALGWHGALSLDAILTPGGPVYIDVNPRLVEPMNAYFSGVDLVAALGDVAVGHPAGEQPAGRPGTRSHQTLLALLGTAAQSSSRRAVAAELAAALRHSGTYADSREELTPPRDDPRALIAPGLVALGLLARPAAWRWFAAGATRSYALSAPGWRDIVARYDAPSPAATR